MALNRYFRNRHHSDLHMTNWVDFERWISEVSGITDTTIFRGQSKAWKLLPSIARKINDQRLLKLEKVSMAQFQERAPRTLQVVPESDWDWLVTAQHHGLPTRLLDWTEDPMIAMWFALREASPTDSAPEIWVMTPLATDVIDDLKHSRPYAGSRTKAFRAGFNHPRIKAQKSWFTATKFVDKSSMAFIPIERNQTLRKRIQRLRISAFAVPRLQEELKERGYTVAKLMPDTDEVASDIRDAVFR